METEKSYGLEAVHKELLKTLDVLDKVCRDNNIHYSLHGGTLLGAERNHRLIPWDDDIDISMTRREFVKLIRVIKNSSSTEYTLKSGVLWIPRFVLKDSDEAVCIDILIWDYISEKKIARFCKINLLRALQGMMKSDIDYSRYGIGGKLLVFITSTFGKLISNKRKVRIFKYIETNCFLGKKLYIHRSNDAFKGVSYVMDAHYMEHYTDIILEGKSYMVTTRYREFLEMNYGKDYLTPPPENERKPIHESIRKNLN